MPLSIRQVEQIAHLARLELTDDEKNRYREQLSAILDFVEQLQRLNTGSMHSQPAVGALRVENTLRDDEPRPGLTADAMLSNAAQKERSQFKIPPVFE
jgi:aspartyl-tRNA(Asn)/glutamyl-tRNA(Gln) amidotransferase subunit C